jgi:hypothetical protein
MLSLSIPLHKTGPFLYDSIGGCASILPRSGPRSRHFLMIAGQGPFVCMPVVAEGIEAARCRRLAFEVRSCLAPVLIE